MAIKGLEIMMSRLDTCGEWLRARQIASDLLAGMDGDVPVLLIYLEQGDAQLACLPMDDDDSMEHFLLDLRAELPLPGMDYVQRQTVCDLFGGISMAGLAYLSASADAVICRQVLPEAVLPTSEETFLYFVELFAQYLGTLKELAERVRTAGGGAPAET